MDERNKRVMISFTAAEYERARGAQAESEGSERWDPFATFVRRRLLRALAGDAARPPAGKVRKQLRRRRRPPAGSKKVTRRRRVRGA
jgi:hypothetical protein